jgi:GTPase SAR1 family protein
MLETTITKKLFREDYDENRESGIDSDDVVVILNPTQYTLKDDDIDGEVREE